jgi:hypothetical protein
LPEASLLKIDRNHSAGKGLSRRSGDQRAAALRRDAAIKEQIEKDRAQSAAKSARLRALRLAKEAADKAEPVEHSESRIAKAPTKRRVVRIFA